MRLDRTRFSSLLLAVPLLTGASCGVARQGTVDPVTTDPAHADAGAPATSVEVEITSSGDRMNGVLYLAGGEGPHPTVILLHGFPGNERNLDLAQAIRRSGINALFFNYRGAWGSGGTFTFAHTLEDVAAAMEYLRGQARAHENRIDSTRIALIGHSLGGWIALQGAMQDPRIVCAAALDFWNIGADGRALRSDSAGSASFQSYAEWVSAPGAPLHTAGPRALLEEIIANAGAFDVDSGAARLHDRPVLLLSTPVNPHHPLFAAAMERAGARKLTPLLWDTDHVFSSRRIELARTLVDWLHGQCRM